MVDSVIRKNVDGIEVDFGPLVIAELDGVRFAIEDWRAKMLQFAYVEGDIPDFYDDLKLVINFGQAQVYVYVFNKEDLRTLGMAFSKLHRVVRVDVVHKSRNLMMWVEGVVVSQSVTIDKFYAGCTPEEIEHSRF